VEEGSIAIATAIGTETVIGTMSEATVAMTAAATLITIAADGTVTDMIAIDMITIDMITTDMIVTATSEIETTIASTNVETGTTITVAKILAAYRRSIACHAPPFCL